MERLHHDPTVVEWMKRHGISIPQIELQKHHSRYVRDCSVKHSDGSRPTPEAKDPAGVDSDEVKRKRKTAEMWRAKRGMSYVIPLVGYVGWQLLAVAGTPENMLT